MQFLLLSSLVPLLGVASAAPSLPMYRITPRLNNNGTAATNGTAAAAATTQLTFTGAGATFTVNAPTDGSNFQIPSSISVDHIAQAGTASCQFKGVNGAQLAILGANNAATLAPPQTVVSGTCR